MSCTSDRIFTALGTMDLVVIAISEGRTSIDGEADG